MPFEPGSTRASPPAESEPEPRVVDVDMARLRRCDLGTIDGLARLALAERRAGRRIRLVGASPALVELVALSGLTRVLPALPRDRSVDVRR
jgi:ABC-type transporter Mla MlaB component